jgi:ribonuclease-3
LPEYALLREEGADHAKKFHVQCTIADNGSAVEGSGSSRRRAEQAAAAKVLKLLQASVAA